MSLNPTPDIGDDLRRTLESSGDPHNIVGFLAWVYANAKTDDPHDVTSFEFQLRCFKNGVAYLSPRVNGAEKLGHWGAGIVYHLPDDRGP